MHTQEVTEEVLAPQEHASGQKKFNCSLSARSSKSYPQEITAAVETLVALLAKVKETKRRIVH